MRTPRARLRQGRAPRQPATGPGHAAADHRTCTTRLVVDSSIRGRSLGRSRDGLPRWTPESAQHPDRKETCTDNPTWACPRHSQRSVVVTRWRADHGLTPLLSASGGVVGDPDDSEIRCDASRSIASRVSPHPWVMDLRFDIRPAYSSTRSSFVAAPHDNARLHQHADADRAPHSARWARHTHTSRARRPSDCGRST